MLEGLDVLRYVIIAIGRADPKVLSSYLQIRINDLEEYRVLRSRPPEVYDPEQLKCMRISKPEAITSWSKKFGREVGKLILSIPAVVSDRLDFSVSSLPVLEEWLPWFAAGSKDMLRGGSEWVPECLSHYLGTVYLSRLGPEWNWSATPRSKTDPREGLPILRRNRAGAQPICPLLVLADAADRRDGHTLTDALASVVSAVRKA